MGIAHLGVLAAGLHQHECLAVTADGLCEQLAQRRHSPELERVLPGAEHTRRVIARAQQTNTAPGNSVSWRMAGADLLLLVALACDSTTENNSCTCKGGLVSRGSESARAWWGTHLRVVYSVYECQLSSFTKLALDTVLLHTKHLKTAKRAQHPQTRVRALLCFVAQTVPTCTMCELAHPLPSSLRLASSSSAHAHRFVSTQMASQATHLARCRGPSIASFWPTPCGHSTWCGGARSCKTL